MVLNVDSYLNLRLDQNVLTESSYTYLDILDTADKAIAEGAVDNHIIDIAAANTTTMILEIIQSVKDALIALYGRVLGYFNNYIINSSKLASKYSDVIISRYDRIKNPITLKTYQYKNLTDKNYPELITPIMIESSLAPVLDKIKVSADLNRSDACDIADLQITEFSKAVIGAAVDPDNITSDTKRIVVDHLRGMTVVRQLTKQEAIKLLSDITKYQALKQSLTESKKHIEDDFTALKGSYMKLIKTEEAKRSATPKAIVSPGLYQIETAEANRYAEVNREFIRMFNGFSAVYSAALTAKIDTITEKIDFNATALTRIMQETNIFSTLNTLPSQSRKPRYSDQLKLK